MQLRETVPSRLDAVVVAAVALAAGGVATVAPWEVAGALAALLAIAWRARRADGVTLAVAVAFTAVGLGRGLLAVDRHEARRALADAAMAQPARCSALATVDSSPVLVRDVLRWDAALSDVVCDGVATPWTGRATLYGAPWDLARGDRAEVVATLAPPQRLWDPATGDPRPGEARRGVTRTGGTLDVRIVRRARSPAAWVDRVRARLRRSIAATFAPDIAPMVRALVLGESDLAAADDQSFRASGLSHLLAVSGMHLVLVLALVVRVLHAALVRTEAIAARLDAGRLSALAGIPAAWLYADVAGGGGSTVRAAWMATAALGARVLGRRGDAARAFGLSVGVMAWLDPLVAFDLSFALSAAATAGLLVYARPLGEALAARAPPRLDGVVRAVATTLAASAPCAPLLARFAPTMPLGGAVANLIAVPLGESAALPLCLAHALLGWWPAAQRGCAVAASGALVLVRAVARVFAAPSLGLEVPPPTPWQLAALATAMGALPLLRRGRGALAAAVASMLLLLEVAARRAGAPRGVLRVTFLDVGQGDSAIVDLPDGRAMVIDGGGLVGSPIDVGQRVLGPELRARRRRALAAAVLTHPHPDHFGGLVSGLDGVRVGALWDSGEGEREQLGGGYAALLAVARARGVPVLRPGGLCGAWALGGIVIDVLAPCPAYSADREANDNSIVLRLVFGARAILMVGDAQREEEGALLATARDRLRADVLKVGHHGSATSSSPAFLAAVAPREAVVSVGRRNRFGHPHPATLAALSAAGARLWRTDVDGAVTVTTDGAGLDVRAIAR
jgi:competence protein ComEC